MWIFIAKLCLVSSTNVNVRNDHIRSKYLAKLVKWFPIFHKKIKFIHFEHIITERNTILLQLTERRLPDVQKSIIFIYRFLDKFKVDFFLTKMKNLWETQAYSKILFFYLVSCELYNSTFEELFAKIQFRIRNCQFTATKISLDSFLTEEKF